MALTKADLIQNTTKQNGFTKSKSSEILESLIEIIKRSLESGEDVLITDFGKFCVKEKKQRIGRNPITGEDMVLGPHKTVRFRCSGKLRNKLNA
jgi:integration host factor subunit alpha